MTQLFSLAGRTALVTGGAGRLGSAIAQALGEAGAHVLVNGRDRDRIDARVATLKAAGLAASPAPFDVTDDAAVHAFMASLSSLDILVNNAALGRTGTVASTEPDAFPSVEASISQAAYRLVRTALPLLRASGHGSVVNVASMYGLVSPDPRVYGVSGHDNPPQYGVAKAGLLQLTRYLACHLASDGVRVNAVSPGPFPPEETLADTQPDFLEALRAKVPLGRLGRPSEVGGAVVFLASDAASYITGANLPIDGGWTAW